MNCKNCGQAVTPASSTCPACGAPNEVSSDNPYQSPLKAGAAGQLGGPPVTEGDGTGGLIPYKNPKALIAYYLGIASGLPLIGFPFGIAAFVLGIMGLRDRNRNPIIKGSIHAGIGIGCGLLFTILWGFLGVGLSWGCCRRGSR